MLFHDQLTWRKANQWIILYRSYSKFEQTDRWRPSNFNSLKNNNNNNKSTLQVLWLKTKSDDGRVFGLIKESLNSVRRLEENGWHERFTLAILVASGHYPDQAWLTTHSMLQSAESRVRWTAMHKHACLHSNCGVWEVSNGAPVEWGKGWEQARHSSKPDWCHIPSTLCSAIMDLFPVYTIV